MGHFMWEMQTLYNTCNFANWELQMAAKGENSVLIYVYFTLKFAFITVRRDDLPAAKPIWEYEQNVVKQTMMYFSHHE